MKLLSYFSAFLKDTVNLDATRLSYLDGRVASITTALQSSAELTDKVLDTVTQGSWAHQTIIKPADGLEFDADFLVQLAEDAAWNENPKAYASAVYGALSNHVLYGSMTKQKNRCSRVVYANDCHIDVIPYIVLADGREVIVNRTTNEFEDTNPVGFTEWLQAKDELTGGHLRRAIRLLKFTRDHRKAFDLKSVLLTTLVGNVVTPYKTLLEPDYYKDLPTTFLHIVEDLDRYLQDQWSKPTLNDPSCPATTFDHRWTDLQFTAFKAKFHTLAIRVRAAYDAGDVAASLEAWQLVFGDKFKAPVVATTASAAVSPTPRLSSRANTPIVGPTEEFADERFKLALTHHVKITCEVTEPTGGNRAQRRRALKSRGGRVPKCRKLLFKVVGTDVVGSYQVYWKVRNRGPEAEKRHLPRGEIIRDEGKQQRSETTDFAGDHFVECYVVQNGVCVAAAREPVVIT